MKKMKKNLLLVLSILFVTFGYSQKDSFWKPVTSNEGFEVSKNTQRLSFPTSYDLYELNLNSFRQALSVVPDRFQNADSNVIITMPNTEGKLERYKMYDASNFTPELQAQYPQLRAYIGIGVDDVYAQLRLSTSPSGIQSMVFRTDKKNEFSEAYSTDGTVYAVFKSSRLKGQLPFTCSTEDVAVFNSVADKDVFEMQSATGEYKTLRLAMSCTGEYTAYFGGTVAGALNAINNSMTRINGVFEKDFAVHMNLIATTNLVIYTNAATDPYSNAANMGNWNAQLQGALTANIGEANYDIGHLFGATGGGGSAGCIGCVCVDGQKGSGITSPADGVPAGDTFDIDYVAHEMGHQFGGNHTFSHTTEDNSVNVEPGSGSTIMGYAGITGSTDVQANSDDYFTFRSIYQVQVNLATKTCPVTTPITHGTPVMNTGGNRTIPKSTAFKLTGSGTDTGGGPLSYCWEQNNDASAGGGSLGNPGSFPSPTKLTGPNFRSFDPVSVPYRYMPALSSVLNNTLTTTWETVSSVARTEAFTLTGRDNVAGGGQAGMAQMTLTISGTVGPFSVTSQNTTGITWPQSSSQTITWATNGAETLAGSTLVDILLSTDGGATFATTLAAATANDGSQIITVPNVLPSTNCRIMIMPTGNIYYAVNTTPFAISLLNAESFGLDNFSLYPNPNNGSFNIKFNSSSNNDIAISVHDMRGRQVFNNSYQNSGLFDQNIQLDNVQAGVYLVTVQEGDKKVVKKIIVQ
jgi:Metallo-peptidase family M12B Reprolysin-like/Secretion system C-terminal sorting domain